MDWMNTAQELVALIIAIFSLISAGFGLWFGVKSKVSEHASESKQQNWSTIQNIAKVAIATAEKSGQSGADKKQMVIDIVTAACEADGIDVEPFKDQLNATIDALVTFSNSLKK